MADAARSILDGHIVLSRRLANAKHFPAIDVLDSVSRVRDDVLTREQRESANHFLQLESAYRSHEDLISVGAYKPGANALVDAAIALRPAMLAFMQQTPDEGSTLAVTQRRVAELVAAVPGPRAGGDA